MGWRYYNVYIAVKQLSPPYRSLGRYQDPPDNPSSQLNPNSSVRLHQSVRDACEELSRILEHKPSLSADVVYK